MKQKMKAFKGIVLVALVLTLLTTSIISASALTTWILPNSSVSSNLQLGGSAVWLKVNSTAGKDVAGGSNATNMSFYWANSTGVYNLIGTNMSAAITGVIGQNLTWSFVLDTTTLRDDFGPYTLMASATNSTSGILENQTITLVETDNTIPTATISNSAGTRIAKTNTVTCAFTNTRTYSSLEFSYNGPNGPYGNVFTTSTRPAVSLTGQTGTFTPSLGSPPEGSAYARCVGTDGTNSTTSSSVQLVIDQQTNNGASSVGVEVGTQVAQAQQAQTNNTKTAMIVIIVVGALFVMGFFSGGKK